MKPVDDRLFESQNEARQESRKYMRRTRRKHDIEKNKDGKWYIVEVEVEHSPITRIADVLDEIKDILKDKK